MIAIWELRSPEEVKRLTQEALKAGIPPHEIITQGLAKGLDVVGAKYEEKEYFIADLVYAASLMKEAMTILEPLLQTEKAEGAGVFVIGTVRGDLHDIGKNIVAAMLRSGGFTVYDLGIDVPAEAFVEKVKEVNADILGLSSLLTSTMPQVSEVLNVLKEKGIRSRVKVMVGGRPVTEDFVKEVGADAYAKDAIDAVRKARELMKLRED
ncbi:corrinoid protein [Candidatus Bathyarchaeota archaeon]|nr:corrinoid protein [Candidatus Bathyarchaeota archaeon]